MKIAFWVLKQNVKNHDFVVAICQAQKISSFHKVAEWFEKNKTKNCYFLFIKCIILQQYCKIQENKKTLQKTQTKTLSVFSFFLKK